MYKSLLWVVTCIDFCDGLELGVWIKDEVDGGIGLFDFVCFVIVFFEYVFVFGGFLLLCVIVE